MNEKTRNYPAQGWIKILFVAAALLLAPSLTAFAQGESVPPCPPCDPPVRVRGTVRSCAGVPIAGVTVNIVGNVGEYSAVTNAAGGYDVTLPADNYVVTPVATTGYFFSPQNAGPSNPTFTRYPRDNRANFDGDCKTDVAVFKASANGLWASLNSSNGALRTYNFGTTGDIATPGDYNADGKTDYAVFRPSEGKWYIETDTSTPLLFDVYTFGLSGDIPVPRDYDGDAKTDVAVFRPSDGVWYILGSSAGFQAYSLSFSDARLVPGDYDGDNKDDIAVYRPSNGTWYVRRSSDNVVSTFQWGLSTDIPVQADYDNDGRTDYAVYRGADQKWYVYGSSIGWTELGPWGLSSDRLVPGDYSGDRRTDPAVQRPSEGTFYILDNVTGGTSQVNSFSSDFPVAAAYLTPLY